MRTLTGGSIALLVALAACVSDTSNTPAAVDEVTVVELKIGDQGGRPLATTLSGAEEVPPNTSPGTGSFVATLNQGQRQICYVLTVRDLVAPVTAAHIHRGAVGIAGGVVVPLSAPVGATSGSTTACASVAKDLIKEIRQHPERFYVNVHTPTYPGGEVRGQLSK